jgi:hypothetical protein
MSAQGAKKTAAKRMVTKQRPTIFGKKVVFRQIFYSSIKEDEIMACVARANPREQRILKRLLTRVEDDFIKDSERTSTDEDRRVFWEKLATEVEDAIRPYQPRCWPCERCSTPSQLEAFKHDLNNFFRDRQINL